MNYYRLPKRKDNHFEIDTPHDGNCLFWAIVLPYLLSVLGKKTLFKMRYEKLFGKEMETYLGSILAFLKAYNFHDSKTNQRLLDNKNLVDLIQRFRERVVNHMEQNAGDFQKFFAGETVFKRHLKTMRLAKTWAGELELKASVEYLKLKVFLQPEGGSELSYGNGNIPIIITHGAAKIVTGANNHYRYLISQDEFAKLQESLKLRNISTQIREDDKPAYVNILPKVVADDNAGVTSSGESDDQTFTSSYFKNPKEHFRLLPETEKKTGHRGVLVDDDIMPVGYQYSTNDTTQRIIDQFHAQAFDDSKNAEARLGVSIGYNKMRSLSHSRNQSLQKVVNQTAKASIAYRRMGFFWDGVWQERKKDKGDWKKADYPRVKKFYRQLKRKDKDLAQQFRQEMEGSKRYHMVPFREIRDRVKNHENTRDLVRRFRRKGSNRLIYLGCMDGDTVNFNATFSNYDNLLMQHSTTEPFEILSNGYTLDNDNPALLFSVLIEHAVRKATAEYIKRGVYYPEPNLLVRVLPGENTVEEGFSDGTSQYSPPQESNLWIDNLIEARQLNPQTQLNFNNVRPLVTATPERMKREFKAYENVEGKFVDWDLDFFEMIRGVEQSHYHNNKWAKNLLKAITIKNPSQVLIDNKKIEITNGSHLRNLLISALSRLFKCYDPVSIAEASVQNKRKNNIHTNFLREFIALTKVEGFTEDAHLEKTNEVRDIKDAEIKAVWTYLDELNDIEALTSFIDQLLDIKGSFGIDGRVIQQAAKACGSSVMKLCREYLCLNYKELIFRSLLKLITEIDSNTGKPTQQMDRQDIDRIYGYFLEAQTLNHKTEIIQWAKKTKQKQSIYDMSPIHLAAIAGDIDSIKWIIHTARVGKQGDWFKNIAHTAQHGILPLHCAIRFCARQDYNEALLTELLNAQTVTAQLADGRDAFYMAIRELPEGDLPLFQKFLDRYDDINKTLTITTRQEKRNTYLILEAIKHNRLELVRLLIERNVELDGLYDHKGRPPLLIALEDLDDPLPMARLLLEQGKVDPNRCRYEDSSEAGSDASDDKSATNDDEQDHNEPYGRGWPIFAAIATGNVELVQLLTEHGAELQEIYNEQDASIALAACHHLPVLRFLLAEGIDPEASDIEETNYPLHECLNHYDEITDVQEVFDLLLEKSTEVEQEDGSGNTPLGLALEYGLDWAVNALLQEEHGLDIENLDEDTLAEIKRLTEDNISNSTETYSDSELDEDGINSEEEHSDDNMSDDLYEQVYDQDGDEDLDAEEHDYPDGSQEDNMDESEDSFYYSPRHGY